MDMRPIYIWQYPEWPSFTWNDSRLIALLSEVRNLEGKIQGMMGGLGFDVQSMTALNVMTEDVLRSNEIEGVILNSDKVRSSIAKHLGIDTAGLPQPDHYTDDGCCDKLQQTTHPGTPVQLARRIVPYRTERYVSDYSRGIPDRR